MEEILAKLREAWDLIQVRIKEVNEKGANIDEVATQQSALALSLSAKEDILNKREEEINKIEDLAGIEQRIKVEQANLKTSLAELEVQRQGFASYVANENKAIADAKFFNQEQKANNDKDASDLNAARANFLKESDIKNKELADLKKKLEEEIKKAITKQAS